MSKPLNYRTLLTQENAKTIKGEKLGYLTGILYLAPATEAGRGDLCPMSTRGCEEGCLFLVTIELDAAGKRHVAGKPDRLVIDLISADVATVAPIGTRMLVRNTKPGRLICTIAPEEE